MRNWLEEVQANYDTAGLDPLMVEFKDYFNSEYLIAKEEVKISDYVSKEARRMPAITEERYYQFQIIQGVLEYLEIKYNQLRSKEFRRFIERYNRDITSRDAEKFIDSEDSVIDQAIKINEVKNLRNKFVSITKGLETKHFQISNITRLAAEGLDVT